MKGQIYNSDFLKILNVLKQNEKFHRYRDLMNSKIHLANEGRFSPITSNTIAAREKLDMILDKCQYIYVIKKGNPRKPLPDVIQPEEINNYVEKELRDDYANNW